MTFPCACGGETKVIDSRRSSEIRAGDRYILEANVRRRRTCANCGARFTTREVLEREPTS